MDYIFFNNEILMSDGKDVRRIEKGAGSRHVFQSVDVAHVCVVDVDVLIAAAVENPIEKKDVSWYASSRNFTSMRYILFRMKRLIIIFFKL